MTKPVRVMKARRPGRLACGHWVLQGEQIVGTGSGWRKAWVCMPCHLAEHGVNIKISTEGKRQ